MGVPALFRWLSKKYPKTIYPVDEEEEMQVPDAAGDPITVPVNMSNPNPNGVEFDCLYLDMNGIVHPCTHPEGKPAPETEEDMMVEIFKYTERVVNMVRPRKLLFMAIDGVAPRAKMNQQRSRRFRSAHEAKEKEEARKEAVELWEAMGKTISDEERNKEAWDSNAITPGTPFMDLLASSLRYWVVQKMNTDPGWKNIQVLISDASVPGEGEHKIMDFIRRQRSNPGHDPNTKHVIYGLDADLIMLALATHEPNFRVLREDVFANDTKPNACRICGQEGHYAAQCTGEKADVQKKQSPDKKPFIFLDVAVLREYLEYELYVPNAPFPFDFERAIDDWVLLIFFVGNDFLPHLPSLEIREGAIDTLLKIWKQELPRMGGYLTNHGQLELSSAQIILEGLAKREDEIFRRRREAEERQDQNAKRRKLDMQQRGDQTASNVSPSALLHPSLPPRPTSFAANADSIGLGAAPTTESVQHTPTAVQALAGSNRDVVANRRSIRMANMSAAEVLKAELASPSATSAKLDLSLPMKPISSAISSTAAAPSASLDAARMSAPVAKVLTPDVAYESLEESTEDFPGLGTADLAMSDATEERKPDIPSQDDPGVDTELHGVKRKFEEGPGEPADEGDEEVATIEDEDEEGAPVPSKRHALKVNPDGTVEQEDTVRLWEPGYKERYYREKFGVEPNDQEFKYNLTKSYVEGMAWVLCYYYQGVPSWQWFYPYHFAPFAADFVDIHKMDIKFNLGQPFKPFEQLMGVFPAASRKHIPEAFHHLMIDESSPIIDFYPSSFEIDMNGKKMAWQGVALLPFIDEKRLLDAMAPSYPSLVEEEVGRNRWGTNVIYASDEHAIYPFYEKLYGKRKTRDPEVVDVKLSMGISGSILPTPECIPGSTYYSPLPQPEFTDIKNDRSLSVLYYFPRQLRPHRSELLPGARKPPRQLSAADLETTTRQGGRGRGRGPPDATNGGGRNSWTSGGYAERRNDPFHTKPNNYGSQTSRGRGAGYGGRGGNTQSGSYTQRPPYAQSTPNSYQQYGPGGGYGAPGGRPPPSHYSTYGGRGAAPPRGPSNSAMSGGGGYNNNNTGGYGTYGDGGYNSGAPGGYGSYGSHSTPSHPARGAPFNTSRGRGRGR
ncbi:exoribonuclease 2 [Amanita muscaria]